MGLPFIFFTKIAHIIMEPIGYQTNYKGDKTMKKEMKDESWDEDYVPTKWESFKFTLIGLWIALGMIILPLMFWGCLINSLEEAADEETVIDKIKTFFISFWNRFMACMYGFGNWDF